LTVVIIQRLNHNGITWNRKLNVRRSNTCMCHQCHWYGLGDFVI